jgi:hypothetical protein
MTTITTTAADTANKINRYTHKAGRGCLLSVEGACKVPDISSRLNSVPVGIALGVALGFPDLATSGR